MPEPEAFFHDLRALRAGAGLSLAELAERAHFPGETLAAAEVGPAVPPNPVLVAYVQACGGPVGQWEDYWRDASTSAASGFLTKVPGPADTLQAAPPRRHRGRRAAAAAAAAAALDQERKDQESQPPSPPHPATTPPSQPPPRPRTAPDRLADARKSRPA